MRSHFAGVVDFVRFWPANEEEVERDGGHDVDDEPALEVVDGDFTRMADDLVVLVDVRRTKVYDDVNEEHDVDEKVDDGERVVVSLEDAVFEHPLLFHVLFVVEEEGSDVGRAYGRVDDEDEDEPVPDGFEGRVMDNCEPVLRRSLEFVLWQHFGTQRKHLQKSRFKCFFLNKHLSVYTGMRTYICTGCLLISFE